MPIQQYCAYIRHQAVHRGLCEVASNGSILHDSKMVNIYRIANDCDRKR